MKTLQCQLSNGAWIDVDEDRIDEFLDKCVKHLQMYGWPRPHTTTEKDNTPLTIETREEAKEIMMKGRELSTGSDWYSNCRMFDEAEYDAKMNALHEKRQREGVKKGGQLWEPCRCGREPVYLPLHLCEKCWPSSA